MQKATAAAMSGALTWVVALLLSNLSLGNKQVDAMPEHLYEVGDPQFLRSVPPSLGSTMTPGNSVQEMLNGSQIFPAMLQAIRGASTTITLETYIFRAGTVGDAFAEALAERARSGVKVHVLIDWFGAQIDDTLLQRLRTAGVD